MNDLAIREAQIIKQRYPIVALIGFVILISAVLLQIQNQIIATDYAFVWRTLTGSMLLSTFVYQINFMWIRWINAATGNSLNAHRWVGVASVFLFALHIPRIGSILMFLISIVYVLVAVTGELNKQVIAFKTRAGYLTWFALHVSLSLALIPMIMAHVWIALAY